MQAGEDHPIDSPIYEVTIFGFDTVGRLVFITRKTVILPDYTKDENYTIIDYNGDNTTGSVYTGDKELIRKQVYSQLTDTSYKILEYEHETGNPTRYTISINMADGVSLITMHTLTYEYYQ